MCPALRKVPGTFRETEKSFTDFELLKRFDLYERAANAYAIVITSEADGNLILEKGPVMM